MLIKVGYVFEIELFKYQRSIFPKLVTFVLIIFVLSDFMIRKLNLQTTCIVIKQRSFSARVFFVPHTEVNTIMY